MSYSARHCTRAVSDYGERSPDSRVLKVDLALYSQLLAGDNRFPETICACFSPETWEAGTTVVFV